MPHAIPIAYRLDGEVLEDGFVRSESPQGAHNDMFNPCSDEGHELQWLLAVKHSESFQENCKALEEAVPSRLGSQYGCITQSMPSFPSPSSLSKTTCTVCDKRLAYTKFLTSAALLTSLLCTQQKIARNRSQYFETPVIAASSK